MPFISGLCSTKVVLAPDTVAEQGKLNGKYTFVIIHVKLSS